MTLVQASISTDGSTVVVIADRLITAYLGRDDTPYEFESNIPKIQMQGNVAIGFAGSSLLGSLITSVNSGKKEYDEICNGISKKIKDIMNKDKESITERYTGLPLKEFYEKQEALPDKLRNFAFGAMAEVDANVSFLVAGFDSDLKPRISIINSDDTYREESFGYATVGSGSQFANMFFDVYGSDRNSGEIEELYFAYRAKRWGEFPSGVGHRTDIILIRKKGDNLVIRDESSLMSKIRNAYEKEHANIEKERKLILNELINQSNGELK